MAKGKKYYVVWKGVAPGIYDTWDDCKEQVVGFSGAKFKSYGTMAEAEKAYARGESQEIGTSQNEKKPRKKATSKNTLHKESFIEDRLPAGFDTNCMAVDAACSGNPGKMEYRGVYVGTEMQIFHFGPVYGTNNIGEFLAIVHALSLMEREGWNMPIYSDSRNAIKWVEKKQCRTTLKRDSRTEELYQIIERAEGWLKTHTFRVPIYKWNTRAWGEIPADFGRKK